MSGFDESRKRGLRCHFAAAANEMKPRRDARQPGERGCRDRTSSEMNNKIEELTATIAGANEQLLRVIANLLSSNAFDELDKEGEAIALIEQQYGHKFGRDDLPLVWSIVEYLSLMTDLRDANSVQ